MQCKLLKSLVFSVQPWKWASLHDAKSLQGMAINLSGTRFLPLGGTQHKGTPVLSEALELVPGMLIIALFSSHADEFELL